MRPWESWRHSRGQLHCRTQAAMFARSKAPADSSTSYGCLELKLESEEQQGALVQSPAQQAPVKANQVKQPMQCPSENSSRHLNRFCHGSDGFRMRHGLIKTGKESHTGGAAAHQVLAPLGMNDCHEALFA